MTDLAGRTVVFRTDASRLMGTGHVMRCLALAAALKARGARCCFVGRAHAGNLLAYIVNQGHEVIALPTELPAHGATQGTTVHAGWLGSDWATDAQQVLVALESWRVDWLIVDHYALDASWEAVLRPRVGRLMVIDDLADRPHACELLLDQNLGRQVSDYAGRVPADCRVLAGPSFALLRPEFAALRERSLQRRAEAKLDRVLVTMGGVDRPNASGAVLQALRRCALPPTCRIDLVMGPEAPWLADVQSQAAHLAWPTQMHVGVAGMAQLMAASDLAIGAAGGTAWERCCLGLPSLLVVLADNQSPGARALEASGAAILLGDTSSVARELPGVLGEVLRGQRLTTMAAAAAQICDGLGVDRVVAEMAGFDG